MDVIVTKTLFELKPHPQNTAIFGDPRAVPEYEEIKRSIRDSGLQEPIVIKEDGTILSGHLRYYALHDIAAEQGKLSHEMMVPVRIHPSFESPRHELEYLFEANIQRRQLSPRQIAFAYKAMVETLESQPKTRKRRSSGGPKPKRRPEMKERVARLFNVSVRNAENLALIYQTAGVPADVLDMVDSKSIAVKTAAEAVKFAIQEAKRRDPDAPVVVSPADVHAYLAYPKSRHGTRLSDLVRGAKPVDEPILIDGVPITGYYGKVETSLPPPFLPKQRVRDMILDGVKYSDRDLSDPGLPLHEAVHRIRARLVECFTNAHNIREDKVIEALEPLMERVAHYLRAMGKEVVVTMGDQERVLPKSLYEKLVMFRVILEEEDPECGLAVLRTLLMDIAKTAQERASAIRREQRSIQPKTTPSPSPIPRKEAPTFNSELDFIVHVIGQETVDFLGSDPSA